MSSRFLLRGVGGGVAFDPFAQPELLGGGEADMTGADLTVNAEKVINWGKSSLIQITQGSDAKRFLRGTAGDGKLELVCDGADDEMATASNFTMNPSSLSIFTIMRITIGGTVMYRGVSGSDEVTFGDRSPDLKVNRGGVISQYDNSGTPSYIDDAHHLFEHQCDGTNAGHFLKADDVLQSWTTNTPSSNPGIASISLPMTFGSFGSFFHLTGAWRAWFVFSPQLSIEVSAQVVTYLNNRWEVF